MAIEWKEIGGSSGGNIIGFDVSGTIQGSGTSSFDLTQYDLDYANLTVDNFVFVCNSINASSTSGTPYASDNFKYTIEYDATIGQLEFTISTNSVLTFTINGTLCVIPTPIEVVD